MEGEEWNAYFEDNHEIPNKKYSTFVHYEKHSTVF
jgi:hypothetical protein